MREDGWIDYGLHYMQTTRQAKRAAPQARRPIRCNLFGGFQGRQATRGGDRLKAVPLECKHSAQAHRAEGTDTGLSRKKAPPPVNRNDAF